MLKRVKFIAILTLTLTCSLSEADISRYATVGHLKFLLTGNSLGLSGATNENGPGTLGSIHTFTSLIAQTIDDTPSNPGNPWPENTTSNYISNGSDAQLLIPDGAVVVYAELIWGGSFRYLEDVEARLGDSVLFTTPTTSTNVSPSAVTGVTLDFTTGNGVQVAYYQRSAEVTALVADGGSGVYQLESVPGTQHELINSSNASGWTLVVAIRDASFACQSVELKTTGQWVDEDQFAEIQFSELSPKSVLPVNGRLLTGAIDGDADLIGDTVSLQSPLGITYNVLSTPNNPPTNFFASQVNTVDGVLDTQGSWGSINHNALTGTNVAGGRQGWDLTGIPLQSSLGHLATGQTQTTVRASSTGDGFVLTFLALEVEADTGTCFVEDAVFSDGFETVQD